MFGRSTEKEYFCGVFTLKPYKLMRKFYSLFIALLAVCGLAQAQTTFTAGVDAAASDDDRTFTKGDITLTITDGRLNTEQYRVYKSQTLTITSVGKKITAIKFTCTANGTAKYGPGSFDAQDGYTFEPEGKIGMWQGEATSVSFTAGSNQVRATEIVVAVEGETIDGDVPGPGPDPQPTDEWKSSAESPVTVAKALELIGTLENGAKSTVEVYVKGKIATITEVSAQYGNATYTIVDEGYDAALTVFRGKYFNGENFTAEDQIKVGDEVVVVGLLQKYVKDEVVTPEVAQGNKIYSLNGQTGGDTPGPQPSDIDWTSSATAPLTVAAVLEKAAKLEAGQSSDKEVYVKGKISQIKYTFSAQYGTSQFSISDNGQTEGEFLCYGTYYLGNRAWAEGDDQINVGDEVIVCGTVTNYNGTLEMANKKNYLYSLNGKTAGGDTPDPGVTTYTKIADMQAAAQGLGTEKVAVKYTFSEAIVLGVKSKNIYMTDGQRGLLLYGTNSKNLKAGDVISGTIAGELQLYNGVTELGNANFDEVTVLDITIVATPVVATIADISNAATKLAYESMLVTIKDVNIVVEEGTVKAIDDSDNEVVLFDNYNFGLAELGFLATETYNVTAIVGNYRGTIQLYPRSKEDIDGTFDEPQTYELEGDGSLEKPYTIADVLHIGGEKENGPKGWVRGFIVGYVNGQTFATGCIFSADAPEGTDREENPLTVSNTNIILAASADVTDPAQCVPVQLANKYGMREALSLKDVPANLGKEVWIQGECIKYFSVAGVKNIEDWSFDGQTLTTAIKAVRTADAATIYNLNGQRVKTADKAGIYVVNGQKMVLK